MLVLQKLVGSHHYLTKAFGETFLVQLVVLLIGLGVLVLRVAALGVEQFGNLVVLLAISSVLASLLSLGLPRAVGYFVARKQLAPTIALKICLIFYSAVSCIIALLCPLGMSLFESLDHFGLNAILVAIGIAYPFVAMKAVLHSIFLSLSCVRAASLSAILESMFLLTSTVLLSYYEYQTALPFLVATCVSIFFGWLAGACFAWKDFILPSDTLTNCINIKELLKYGVSQNGVAALLAVQARLDLFAVRLVLGEFSAGLYAIALQVTEKANVLVQSFCSVYLPYLTASYRKQEETSKEKSVLISVVMAILTFFSSMGGVFLMFLWAKAYGNVSFIDSAPIAIVLCWGVSARAVSRVANVDCHARGDLYAIWFRAACLTIFTVLGITCGLIVGTPLAVAVGTGIALTVDALLATVLNSIRRRQLIRERSKQCDFPIAECPSLKCDKNLNRNCNTVATKKDFRTDAA